MEINEKKLKEILEEQKKDFKGYVGVLAEDFGSQVKIVAESLLDIQKQLTSIREMVAKNTEDIEITKMDIQFIKQELKHKVDVDEFFALEKRVAILEAKSLK